MHDAMQGWQERLLHSRRGGVIVCMVLAIAILCAYGVTQGSITTPVLIVFVALCTKRPTLRNCVVHKQKSPAGFNRSQPPLLYRN